MFYSKTTTVTELFYKFVYMNIIIFCHGERFSEFEELADVRWMMYLWGTTGAIAFFVFSIIITHVTNKTI